MLVENTKPNVAIFLDIDGVLGSNTFPLAESIKVNKIVTEMTGDRYHTFYCKRCITCSTAQTHLFKTEVVESLHNLINKINDIANVHIVISSTWRIDRTINDLKQIFQMHEFSKYIFDKTIDIETSFLDWKDHCVYPHVEINIENCMKQSERPDQLPTDDNFEAFIYKNWECRASQISRWLKEHPEYAGFVIFDDLDEHLSNNFGNKFISTVHLHETILKSEDTEKAFKSIVDQLALGSDLGRHI